MVMTLNTVVQHKLQLDVFMKLHSFLATCMLFKNGNKILPPQISMIVCSEWTGFLVVHLCARLSTKVTFFKFASLQAVFQQSPTAVSTDRERMTIWKQNRSAGISKKILKTYM